MSAEERQTIKPVKVGEGLSRPPGAPAAAAAEENTEFTAEDVEERDTRPFFFRHVTAVVKFCAVFIVAGQPFTLTS